MPRPRKDEPKALSRQCLYQKKRSAMGLCEICGGVNDGEYLGRCTPCMTKQKEKCRPARFQAWHPGSVGRKPKWWKTSSAAAQKDISDSVGV